MGTVNVENYEQCPAYRIRAGLIPTDQLRHFVP